ncbi:MAG: VWA domain-containing protein [Rubrivivax sp.]
MLRAPTAPGHLAENVMHFARVLRTAGMPVGTDRVQLALNALQVAGLESRTDFYAVLAACLLDRVEHRDLFDQAFFLFWRDPDLTGRMRALLLPKVRAKDAGLPTAENRRLAGALFPNPPRQRAADEPQTEELEVDAALTWNDREVLRKSDFETMTAEEWRRARQLLATLNLVFEPLPTRRTQRAPPPGRADWRATLTAMARHGGELWDMRWRRRRTRPAPLVLLADISGSMSRYSRMLLHFGHALGHAEARVESFVFGTRLTRTTRLLRSRDPDLAVGQVVRAVDDWSGGTRITACLREFNQRWARRVLGGSATLLLVTDGLEHGDPAPLAFEMERLHKSCRRLIWLNPLLRFDRFEPRAGGVRAMLPHVDRFLPVHNLESLEQLVQVLASPTPQRSPTRAPPS